MILRFLRAFKPSPRLAARYALLRDSIFRRILLPSDCAATVCMTVHGRAIYPAADPASKKVWACLLTNEAYLRGVLTLYYSLVRTGTKYPFYVIYTEVRYYVTGCWQQTLGVKALDILRDRNIRTLQIPYLLPGTTYSVTESRFNETWSKIHIYGLEQFDRIAVLDGDMLALRNMDELMEISIPDDRLAATHACVCNPRILSHYPPTWYISHQPQLIPGYPKHALIHTNHILLPSKRGCQRCSGTVSPNWMAVFRYSSPRNKNTIGYCTFSTPVNQRSFSSQIKVYWVKHSVVNGFHCTLLFLVANIDHISTMHSKLYGQLTLGYGMMTRLRMFISS